MEEDTGKSLHVGGATGRIHGADYSLVDYNRAGIPLIEIVTKPIMGAREKAPAVARAYVAAAARPDRRPRRLRRPDGPGLDLRADVNLSLAPKGSGRARHPHRDQERQLAPLGRAGRALRDAAPRGAVLEAGGSILQETRHWHEDTGVTTSGREKSDAEDYRYFPEPDLVPGRAVARVGRGAARHAAGEPDRRSGPGCRPSGASPTSRCATPSVPVRSALVEETIAAGATAAGGPQVVARRAGPPRQRDRRRPRRAGGDPGRGGAGPGARRRRHDQRQAGPPGLRRPARRRGHAPTRSSRPAASRSSPTTAPSARPSTTRSPPTPTSPTRSATARSPPPAP